MEMQILAFVGDNASSNDTQTVQLDKLANSFEVANRVRCFNHIMQLSAKALLKPFNALAASSATSNSDVEDTLDVFTHDDDEDVGVSAEVDDRDASETEDPFEGLDDVDKEELLQDTVAIRDTLNKVRSAIAPSMSWTQTSYRFANSHLPLFT